MQLTPVGQLPPQPRTPITPTVQAGLAPAVVAAQTTAPQAAKTQTVQATAAAGKSDGTRDTQSRTKTGQAVDSFANAVSAETNRMAAGGGRRGSRLDVVV